jgi:hypothetical protein
MDQFHEAVAKQRDEHEDISHHDRLSIIRERLSRAKAANMKEHELPYWGGN